MAVALTLFGADPLTFWTAFTGISTAALVVGAGLTLWRARATWRDETRAYVIADFEPSLASAKQVDFVMRNIGRTPAFDVTITWEPAPESSLPNHPFVDVGIFRHPTPMVAPGREYRFHFDTIHLRGQRPDLPSSYLVTISYRDRWNKPLTHPYWLQVNPLGEARVLRPGKAPE